MKMRLATLLVTGLISAPAFSGAAGDTYVGAQFAQVTYDESGLEDMEPTALVGRVGHFLADHFSLEARVGVGVGDDSISEQGVTAEVELDHLLGGYGVGHLPINEFASVYALAGFTRGEATAKASYMGYSASVSDDDSGFSYGVGGQLNLSSNMGVTAEYVSYLDKSDYQITAISAGLNYTF